jgi:hypothetical protein
MADEPHPPPHPLPGIPLVGRTTSLLVRNGTLNGLTGDADLVGDVNELFQRKSSIGRIGDQIIEARREIDDLSHLVAREPLLLTLNIHDGKSTGRERSVFGQIDTEPARITQHNGAIPIA